MYHDNINVYQGSINTLPRIAQRVKISKNSTGKGAYFSYEELLQVLFMVLIAPPIEALTGYRIMCGHLRNSPSTPSRA
jgi:hypothetical protein